MGETTAPEQAVHTTRLEELIDVVIAIASFQFEHRARVDTGDEVLDGLATGINMLAEEIGKRVEREQVYQRHVAQNERLIAVGQLAAGIAHEVNNPAAFVIANLQMIEHTLGQIATVARGAHPDPMVLADLADHAQEMTRENIGGLDRIVAIVRDLRHFTRGGEDVSEVVDLVRVIQEAGALVRGEIVFRATLDLALPPHLFVRGDRTKLTQVFTNLLMNSAHAIPETSSTPQQITVRACPDGASVCVHVADTGSGIPETAQARLFEPFFTTKPRERGSGLGLVISAEIVRAHGGELRLVQTSPAGTTFEVRLPLELEREAAPVTPPASVPALALAGGPRPRVLLIDDEPQLLAAYRRLLAPEYHVQIATSGREAMDRLSADTAWDVILCDVMMPEHDGTAVHEWIVEHAPALEPRVIFCTGGAFSPRGVVLADRYADRVLHKPFSTASLRAAVARVARPEALT